MGRARIIIFTVFCVKSGFQARIELLDGSDTWVSWMEDLASIEASSAYIQLQCFNKINLVLN